MDQQQEQQQNVTLSSPNPEHPFVSNSSFSTTTQELPVDLLAAQTIPPPPPPLSASTTIIPSPPHSQPAVYHHPHRRTSTTTSGLVVTKRVLNAAGSGFKSHLLRKGARFIPGRGNHSSNNNAAARTTRGREVVMTASTQYGSIVGTSSPHSINHGNGVIMNQVGVDTAGGGNLDMATTSAAGGGVTSESTMLTSSPVGHRRPLLGHLSPHGSPHLNHQHLTSSPSSRTLPGYSTSHAYLPHDSPRNLQGGGGVGMEMNRTGIQQEVELSIIVHTLESLLRKIFIVVCAYVLGATSSNPEQYLPLLAKILELIGAAWGTCLSIIVLTWIQRQKTRLLLLRRRRRQQRLQQQYNQGQLHQQQQEQQRSWWGGTMSQSNGDGGNVVMDSATMSTVDRMGNDERNMVVGTGNRNENVMIPTSTPKSLDARLEPVQVGDNDNDLSAKKKRRAVAFQPETTPLLNNDSRTEGMKVERRAQPTPIELLPPTTTTTAPPPGVEKTAIENGTSSPSTAEDDDAIVPSSKLLTSRRVDMDFGKCPSTQPHPSLDDFFLISADTFERLTPNGSPAPLQNDLFDGQVLVMIRTPDVDGEAEPGNAENERFANYFKDKQRRFEFQWQLKLKKVPTGRLFLGCEVDEPVKMGMIQRAFANAALNFVKKMNNGFHYSVSGGDSSGRMTDKAIREGRYEKSHISFTVDGSMDRLVATKPGQPLPKLGDAINEDAESIKNRKKGGTVDWNLEDTYTMGLYSGYVDLLKWKCMNFPGIRPFSLTSVVGTNYVNLTLYQLGGNEKTNSSGNTENSQHFRCDMEIVCRLELSNASRTSIGPYAKKWIASNAAEQPCPTKEVILPVEEPKEEEKDDTLLITEGTLDQEEKDRTGEEDFLEEFPEHDDEEDAATVAELGEGIYLKSGDKVILREAVDEGESTPLDTDSFVTIGGGFAVLQSQAASTIIIERAGRKRKGSRAASNLIKNGDTVMIKLVEREQGEESSEVKYLSLHRGWWLKWVTEKPRHNGYFTMHTHETEVDGISGKMQRTTPGETQTSYLTLGGSFWLQHRRWSRYAVGVRLEESATFGGRMLGLCKSGATAVSDDGYNTDEDEEQKRDADLDGSDLGGKGKRKWMKPLHFCADLATPTNVLVSPSTQDVLVGSLSTQQLAGAENGNESEVTSRQRQQPEVGEVKLDVPAWVEMMHRTKRTRQRAYLVRVLKDDLLHDRPVEDNGDDKEEQRRSQFVPPEIASNQQETADVNFPTKPTEKETRTDELCAFVRLRTGRDLATILQLGLSWRSGQSFKESDSYRFPEGDDALLCEDEKRVDEMDAIYVENTDDIDHLDQNHCAIDSVVNPVGSMDVSVSPLGVSKDNDDEVQNVASDDEASISGQIEERDDGGSKVSGAQAIGQEETLCADESAGKMHAGDSFEFCTPSVLKNDDFLSPKAKNEMSVPRKRKSLLFASSGETKEGKIKKKNQILNIKGKKTKATSYEANILENLEVAASSSFKRYNKVTVPRTMNGESDNQKKPISTTLTSGKDNQKKSSKESEKMSALMELADKISQKGVEAIDLSTPPSETSKAADDEMHESDDDSDSDESEILVYEEDPYENAAEDDGFDEVPYPHLDPLSPSRRGKKWMTKPRSGIAHVAKSVKTSTSITGKQVVKQGMKVGKGTVIAGRAIISKGMVHSAKPPGREPRKRIKSKRDHHEAVNKAMKSLKAPSPRYDLSARILAGQLSAPDQSCRTVSHVLSEMSSVPESSAVALQFNTMLIAQVGSSSELDSWFLRGGSVELGVVPTKNDDEKVVHECLVARCLWESHWREEWCGLYNRHLSFYVPLSKKAAFEIPFQDVQSVRRLDPPVLVNPLPGYPLLVIETPWRCHYLAFAGKKNRETFLEKLNGAIFCQGVGDSSKKLKPAASKDGWKMHFWEGFQNSVECSLSGGRGKWAPISSSSKSKQRIILNGRRMVFDSDNSSKFSLSNVNDSSSGSHLQRIGSFVEEVLTTALSFSVDSLEKHPKQFLSFLDDTSCLRSLPLDKLDLSGKEAFCIFVNLYHCLLQHALLIRGPPTKRSVGHFMRCTSYEIGGDVFSLAELQCCVIRGNMSRAVNPKCPYVEAPKASQGHRFYALSNVDPRVNFLLNNGDLASPSSIPVLTPERLESQLTVSCSAFLEKQFTIDVPKRTIFLPYVCLVYRNDFGNGDSTYCVMFCVQFLSETKQIMVVDLFNDDEQNPTIKFQTSCDQFHSNLTLVSRMPSPVSSSPTT